MQSLSLWPYPPLLPRSSFRQLASINGSKIVVAFTQGALKLACQWRLQPVGPDQLSNCPKGLAGNFKLGCLCLWHAVSNIVCVHARPLGKDWEGRGGGGRGLSYLELLLPVASCPRSQATGSCCCRCQSVAAESSEVCSLLSVDALLADWIPTSCNHSK